MTESTGNGPAADFVPIPFNKSVRQHLDAARTAARVVYIDLNPQEHPAP